MPDALAHFGRLGATVDTILPLAYDDTPRAREGTSNIMNPEGAGETAAEFERGFVAVRALLGCRGESLAAPLRAPSAGTLKLVADLGHSDRGARAARLAAELTRLAWALEARRLA